MQKVVFSPRFIENLNGETVADPQTPGLSVVSRSGLPVTWSYKRKVRGTARVYKRVIGTFPAVSIAQAREIGREINAKIEAGIDPREAAKAETIAGMSVGEAHAIYMAQVKVGERKTLKPRTIEDKERLWGCAKSTLEMRTLVSITDDDLWAIVEAKAASGAPIRANRIAAELKVFFSWCAGRAGRNAGVSLAVDPSASLNGTWYGVSKRDRTLTDDEIVLFLRALAEQDRVYQRALGILLLTGCRRGEVMTAPNSERVGDLWTIPASRYKSNIDHVVPCAGWLLSLMETNSPWLISAKHGEKPMTEGWINNIAAKMRVRMMELGECMVPHFVIHDLRRTLRSNTKRLKIDRDTAEAMIGHKKTGLEEIYDRYDMLDEKREGFSKWEAKLVGMAREAGVAAALGIPDTV